MADLLLAHRRRAVRRRVRALCRAMHWERFDLVGERLLDLSPQGALLACDGAVRPGDEVLLSFRMPWLGPHVVLTAEVRRVIEGWRRGDPGYCAGLRFVDLEPEQRAGLRRRLALLEPTDAARPHPIDYARTVRVIGHRAPELPPVLSDPRGLEPTGR